MKYLIILFVIFLALAPLSHFVPSKRQRRVARMREYAAVHGLFVEFRQAPGSDQRAVSGETIYYGKRLPPARGEPIKRTAWVVDEQGWRSVGRYVPVPEVLLQLPLEVLAASVDEGSCGVYWSEHGEEETVEQIRSVLDSWSSILRPTSDNFS